jgi:A/G-specific adenine glycosylase
MEYLNQIVLPLLDWYHKSHRILPWRETADPYYIWISEIMLQQTRVEAVISYYNRFIKELPTVYDLADVTEEKLLKLWEGLGYYSRARNLQKAAKQIVSDYGGQLPADFKALCTLPGIGEYTAGAIASIAFGIPVPAVDGNVLRVIARILAITDDITSPKTKKYIADRITPIIPKESTGDFTQSLMELGALICLPNGAPLCNQCPLSFCCKAKKQQLISQIPRKKEKPNRKIEQKTVFALFCENRLALRKREEKGVLSGLWELPNTDSWLTQEEIKNTLLQWQLEPLTIEKQKTVHHIFTHIEWRLSYYFITVKQPSPFFEWVTLQELEEQYPLPNAFRQYEKQIKQVLSAQDEKK